MPETNSTDDLSYLEVDKQDKKVLKNLSKLGEHLIELRKNMLAKEAEYEQSKKEYEHFANVILPQEMFSVGLTSMTLANGGQINVLHKYYVQPNKNDDDRRVMSDWLRKNQGEHLIKSVANVAGADIDKLKKGGIPFTEKNDINTNSLKAFLMDGLGLKGGVQKFTVDDIPACIHFQEVSYAELSIPEGGN
jgi:hypothetical protein